MRNHVRNVGGCKQIHKHNCNPGLQNDLIHAQGDTANEDKSAIVILPTYANGKGLTPNKRYEIKAGAQNGDSCQSVYIGLNYYLNDHKLKLMGVIEFSEMDGETDYDACTIFSGLRFYF